MGWTITLVQVKPWSGQTKGAPRLKKFAVIKQRNAFGRNRPTKVEVYLRVLGRDGLRMYMLLLDGLAEKYLMPLAADGVRDLKSRQRFMGEECGTARRVGPVLRLLPPSLPGVRRLLSS